EKVDAALKNDLKPIFCIGETKEERESGSFFDIIKTQLSKGLFHLSPEAFKSVVLAYEPVWAIGTGLTASPEQAQEVHAFIRKTIAEKYGEAIADDTTILYGGSANPSNAQSLFSQPDIDGGLIGGASLKSRDFLQIITVFNAIYMKYSAVTFTSSTIEDWQKDLLISELAEIGFDTFEDIDGGFEAYIPSANLDIQALESVLLSEVDGFDLDYQVKEIEEKNWNQIWES